MEGEAVGGCKFQKHSNASRSPSTIMTPRSGFYTLARDVGKLHSTDEKQELEFWLNELKRLRSYWKSHPCQTDGSQTIS